MIGRMMPVESSRFIRVPEKVAEKHRLKAEQRREYKAKWDAINRPSHTHGKVPYKDRLFIVWDGEGPRDTGYSLLGNSEGQEICYPKLKTRDCLDLILQSAVDYPGAIHVSFGFTYDVSNILWELSWAALNRLYKFNRTYWKGYVIEHIPRKWFLVKYGNIRVKIFDIQSFFGGSLVSALETWKIGPWTNVSTENASQVFSDVPALKLVQKMSDQQLVTTFKKLRSEFEWKDIEQIRLYMRLELKYSKILIEEVRNAFSSAGYLPRSWHGPGAVARMAFRRHGIYNVLTDTPAPVSLASQFAFVAGRFELVLAGHIGRVYTADINSAYPWFCSQLPNLRRGKWRHTNQYEDGKFGVYHIEYWHSHTHGCNRGCTSRSRANELYPLPMRTKAGNVIWGPNVIGWYWNPEAALVANDPDATFIEGWVFDEDDPTDRPFAWIGDYFDQRRQWKDDGNPAEYTLKLIINSIYGQLAQRVGWDKKHNRGPKCHQLEYAGWITSSCRAMVYRIAIRCGVNLVSIDTDGVTSRTPFSWLESSSSLGGWKLEEFSDSIFWQSGIYVLKEGDSWKKAKTRGIAKGSYSADDLFTCLRAGTPLKLVKKVFISYGLALNGQLHLHNQWMEEPHEIQMGGTGKRVHQRSLCTGCATRHSPTISTPEVHQLRIPTFKLDPYGNNPSEKHKLPWIDSPEEMREKNLIDRLVLFDRNDLDPDEEWTLEYASE